MQDSGNNTKTGNNEINRRESVQKAQHEEKNKIEKRGCLRAAS